MNNSMLVLVHHNDRPGDVQVYDTPPGALIPLDDRPDKYCWTRLSPSSRTCACGRVLVDA